MTKIKHVDREGSGFTFGGMVPSVQYLPDDAALGVVWATAEDGRLYTKEEGEWFEVAPAPPSVSDLEVMFQQIRDFVRNREVRLLTRKANSQKDSGVAYETVFPSFVQDGTLQIHIRVDEAEAVAAVHVEQHAPIPSQQIYGYMGPGQTPLPASNHKSLSQFVQHSKDMRCTLSELVSEQGIEPIVPEIPAPRTPTMRETFRSFIGERLRYYHKQPPNV